MGHYLDDPLLQPQIIGLQGDWPTCHRLASSLQEANTKLDNVLTPACRAATVRGEAQEVVGRLLEFFATRKTQEFFDFDYKQHTSVMFKALCSLGSPAAHSLIAEGFEVDDPAVRARCI